MIDPYAGSASFRGDATQHIVRVLHVSEAFGSGVEVGVGRIISATPEHSHSLLVAPRMSAQRFDSYDVASFQRMTSASHLGRVREVLKEVRRTRPHVVHAHSSLAGAYVRLLAAAGLIDVPVVYSPHAFAHLRLDVGRARRAAYRITEFGLARYTSLVVANGYEEFDAVRRLSRTVPIVVFYMMDPATARQLLEEGRAVPDGKPSGKPDRLRVLTTGRICAQKDPGYFVAVVEALRAQGFQVEAKWIGDVDQRVGAGWQHRNLLERAEIAVTGWLPHHEVQDLLSRSQGWWYVHSAAWEAGIPLAVFEASAHMLPVALRDNRAKSDVRNACAPLPITGVLPQDLCIAMISAHLSQQSAQVARSTRGVLLGLSLVGVDQLGAAYFQLASTTGRAMSLQTRSRARLQTRLDATRDRHLPRTGEK